jgi:hypothetical protein
MTLGGAGLRHRKGGGGGGFRGGGANKHKAWEFRRRLVEQGLLTREQVGAMSDCDIVGFALRAWKTGNPDGNVTFPG